MEFRQAQRSDMIGVIGLLLDHMGPECALQPVAADKVVGNVESVFDHGLVIVGVRDGEVVASIGLVRSSFWYSRGDVLTDRWTYIRPDARRGGAWEAMRDMAKGLADSQGIPLSLRVTSAEKAEEVTRLMRRDMTFVGGAFWYDPTKETRDVLRG